MKAEEIGSSAKYTERGFTLVEVLVVLTILALIASVVLANLSGARDEARESRAQADLATLDAAIEALRQETGLHPNALALSPCVQSSEVSLSECAAGIECTDGSFPGWGGPYLNEVSDDPWGNAYYFDAEYACDPATTGCGDTTGNTRVIQSFGPDGTQTPGGGDDVVRVLCAP